MAEEDKSESSIDLLKYAIGNLTNTWGQIVSSFKTEVKSELKQILTGRGFSDFAMSTQSRFTPGVKGEAISKFKDIMMRGLKIPNEQKQKVSGNLHLKKNKNN